MPRKKTNPPPPDDPTNATGADAVGVSSPPAGLKSIVRWDELPPEYLNNRPNPEHDRAILSAMARTFFEAAAGNTELGKGINPDQLKNFVLARAKMRGIEPKSLMDARSEGDKILDAVTRLIEAPDSIGELVDAELDLLERESESAVALCRELIDGRRPEMTIDDELDRERRRLERGKQWLNRIRREKRLREGIRTTRVPKGEDPVRMASAYQAAKPLLFMLKVQRSSMNDGLRDDSQSKIMRIGRHHARFAVDTWEARNGIEYTKDGVIRGEPFKGVELIAPPGHGKSQFASSYLGLEICERPDTQIAYLHAKVDMAKKYMGYIVQMFTDDNAMGRRVRALYPKARAGRYNATDMWLDADGKAKSPTLQAAGVTSAGLGTDTHMQVWDDVVPQSDRDQPTERARRFEILNGTWATRQRGKKTFVLCIGTLWHNDDALAKFMELSKKQRYFLVSRQVTGGPTTSPAFFPLWPDVYPASELRKRFEGMNRNASLWSANYMANPIADESRLIRRVRLYDPNTEEHNEFVRSSQFHVTIDPTATNREKSDHAGVLYGGLGEVKTTHDGQDFYQRRFRFMEAARLHINQIELAHHVAGYTQVRPVYEVHIEVRSSSGSATCDLLQMEYGLEVRRHDPTNIKKGVRLKACAGLIDNSSPQNPAVVEFPGVWNEKGEFVVDPRFQTVVDQLVNFGVAADDEYVDCVSQLINHFIRSGELVAGAGEATRTIRSAIDGGNPRLRGYIKQMFQKESGNQDAEQEESSWMQRRWQ